MQTAPRPAERRSGKERRIAGARRVNPDPTLLLSDEEHKTIDAAYAAIVEVMRKHGLTPPSESDFRDKRLRNGIVEYVLTVAG